MEKKGIYFNELLNKNIVNFDLCNYKIEQVALSLANTTYINAPTSIASDIIFTVLEVDDSEDLIQKVELSSQNCYYIREWDGVNKSWKTWQTPNGQGGSAGVTKVSSANTDIKVENETTTPVLTLNSTVDGAVNKIVKLDENGNLGSINVGTKGKVINPKTLQESTLNQALVDAYSIPNITINCIQFNAPVSSLYSADLTETIMEIKNINGTIQSKQKVQLCNKNGLIQLDQLFCATVEAGKTLKYRGRLTAYNAEAITQTNYYIIVQVVGTIAGTGQWVNLSDSTSVQISKTQYAYTPINFSGQYTNPSGSAIDAIGIRVQLFYGQQNATTFVDTMFVECYVV